MFLKSLIKRTENFARNASTKANNAVIHNTLSSPIASNSLLFHQKRHYASFKLLRNLPKPTLLLIDFTKKTNLLVLNKKMSTTQINHKLVERFDNIITSSQDKRNYRGLLLDNKLKCLLINDPLTDRSAAAVDVHAGYMLDPKEFPGLAHFCEHMLFMGSKKYPIENTFSKFIEDHAGSTNAYTSNENTNYHFEVAKGNFREALDIFAQFFISPTFHESSTDREINAVDSENQKNLQSDPWRIDQLDKSTCREDHPYSKFGTGNLQTLKTEPEKLNLNVRDELLNFHSKYYSSNLMQLCLLGNESLDELEKYAVEMFSEIPNKNLSKVDFPTDPYKRDIPANVLYVVPVQDLRQLSISWVIPDSRDSYQSNPSNYISHLVGHEGEGSLLSELKKKGWCNNLYAGARREARGFQFFNLTVDLSEDGGENVEEILKLVHQYLNMLKQEKPYKWIFDEMNDLGKIKFSFKDKEKPIGYVSSIASNMQVYAIEDVLSAGYYLTKFDPEAIQQIFEYLTPEKMKIAVISKKYEGKTDQTEKWYGTEYKMEALNEEILESLKTCGRNDAFKLPSKNSFIPSNLSLINHKSTDLPKFPRLIQSTPLTRLWYKEDTKFLLPKAYLRFEIRNPLVYYDPVNLNMTNLFVELFRDSITEYSYEADLAGLRYGLNPNNYGLNISFSGFNDKMDVLLNKVFERMASFRVDSQRFNILKESYKRNLMNFEAEQPYQHSVYYLTLLISEKGWTKQQLLNTINDFTLEDLQAFIPRLLTHNIFIESIMYGNLTEENALEYLNIVENKLKSATLIEKLKPLHAIHSNNLRQVKLPIGSNSVFLKENTIHKTNAIEVYYQCGVQDTRDNALVELFCQVISESSFNVLRTQEQLGYIVASGVRNFGGVQGVRIIVQSEKSPSYLEERIENFIRLTKDTIAKMTDEEFKTHVEALALSKLEEPKKMSRQCDIYFNEITSHQYNFDRENIEVEELRKLTKDDLSDFFNTLIDCESKWRRKLSVYIHHSELKSELTKENIKATLVEDLNEWRTSLKLYPLKKPFIELK